MTIYQFRPGTKVLVALSIASVVSLGAVGCSERPTTSASSSAGEASSSVSAQSLVDVEKVWATHPMPPCPDVLIGNRVAPSGLSLPDDTSVAHELEGVRSPGSSVWVTRKLGWVTKALAETRAGIIDANAPGDDTELRGFQRYVAHVKTELQAGRDIMDSDADGDYPEGCR
ncbi:Uncharacterised protein [Mycobacteroides abscessus subsp. abscessus]|uniref:hypothetical protein n=1 Tax=Mycobacteroides abscessus TaxID=36809 RepID=UPI000926F22F|nr:hypothetical protein [Mycobacteroides abscessus]SIG37450.1 Uncharacterised protein [Mycobacteroides abscessus subsp. abscessus]